MLNTKKLLYIMPDSAYLAELLPSKKAHTFTIQVFRQINGDFLNDNEFIPENIDKLIKKIDPDEYHVILPDFLFTNTIVDVNETSENEVKKYLKETLLPELDLSKETHELDTFILTQHKGKSKVQLSALEKSLLSPLQKACEDQKIKVVSISPLSWTMKSVISLEPSLSTIQMGSMLYLSQHYIGIDQAISFKIEEAGNIIETVKTLKGAEPNIQTMYLLTNALVESELKEKLSGTLPIQQLANYIDEQEGMPAYIKQIIEASAKTLDIADYPVPRFELGKYVASASAAPSTPATVLAQDEKQEELADLPKPAEPKLKTEIVEEKVVEEEAKKEEPKPEVKKLDLGDSTSSSEAELETLPTPTLPKPPKLAEPPEVVGAPKPIEMKAPVVVPVIEAKITPPLTTPLAMPSTRVPQANVLPLGYMQNSNTPSFESQHSSQTVANPGLSVSPASSLPPKPKTIIKNKNGTGSLLKVVGITLAALLITVGLGVGIGFGLLSYTQKKDGALEQNVVANPTTTPEATVEPSPSPSPIATTVAKDKVKILVVNATSTAGKAGKLKTTLTSAGYKSVETGNAKGTYSTPGTFVLMDAEDQSFISTLSKDTGLTLTYSSAKSDEDTKGAFDVIIVINE